MHVSTLTERSPSSLHDGLLSHVETRYRFKIQVPARSQLYYDGNLRLALNTSAKEGNSFSGWDNIKVNARYNCEAVNSTPHQDRPPSSAITNMPPTIQAMEGKSPSSAPLKFPTSTPIIPPSKQPEKSPIVESSPTTLQLNAKLAIDTPLVKLSTSTSLKTQSNVLENIFAIRTVTKSPTAKRT